MDVVLAACDDLLLDNVYSTVFPATDSLPSSIQRIAQWGVHASSNPTTSLLSRDSIIRQFTSLSVIALISAFILYFAISSVSYFFIFDRRLEHHPRYLTNQVRKEITLSVQAMPVMALVIAPWFVVEVRGGSRLYDGWLPDGKTSMFGLGPIPYTILAIIGFLLFTDFCIYWIHRWLHIPFIYKRLHKPHHRWLVPTPFAAMAFHPLDGYAQSLPYHVIVHILPMNKWLYLGLFSAVNVWTVLIHDGDMITGHFLESYINSPAHHTLHHLYFTCNYGQYFTWADYYNGSYRAPRPELDPIHESLRCMKLKQEKERLEVEKTERESDSGYEGSEVEGMGKKESGKESGKEKELRRRR